MPGAQGAHLVDGMMPGAQGVQLLEGLMRRSCKEKYGEKKGVVNS